MADMALQEQDLAKRLNLSRRTLQNWRSIGKGPRFLKLSPGRGGRVRYRLEDVLAWEQARATDCCEGGTR